MTGEEKIPQRVLDAESRREFREQMSRSSIGCPAPWPGCGHMLVDHFGPDGLADDFMPINPRCTVAGCDCGGDQL